MDMQIRTATFNLLESNSELLRLASFKSVGNSCGIREDAPMWILPQVVCEPATVALSRCLIDSSKIQLQQGVELTKFYHAAKYLLEQPAADDVISKPEADSVKI